MKYFYALILMLATWGAQAMTSVQYQADFKQLVDIMYDSHANLKWLVTERNINLEQQISQTKAALSQAKGDDESKAIISEFINYFNDPHMRLKWKNANVANNSTTESMCERLGFFERHKVGIKYRDIPEFNLIEDKRADIFEIGVLSLENEKVGVLKIDLFDPRGHPEICKETISALKLSSSETCDEKCLLNVEITASNILSNKLVDHVKLLEDQGIAALMVDIASNGGGSNWSHAVARLLTRKKIKSASLGFIRHPHWVGQLTQSLSLIEQDLLVASNTKNINLLLAKERYNKALKLAKMECPDQIKDYRRAADCELVVKNIIFSTGALDYVLPGELDGLKSKEHLFNPSIYEYREGAFDGPLLVHVDEWTASSSELFASTLSDNNAASIIGVPTMGAGCGYTNDGIEHTLEHSKATVLLPDCVRFRADGSNEVFGVTPDILLPWRMNKRFPSNEFQRGKILVEGLKPWMKQSSL